jgi:hypothetical protein
MRVSEPFAVGVLLMALLACKGTSSDAPTPAATAGVVQPPKPSADPPAEPKRQVLARFDGTNLQECVEITTTAGKESLIEKIVSTYVKLGFTRIGQGCDSLGHVALGSCTTSGLQVRSIYDGALMKEAMAACLKEGDSWSANTSPEANLAKAQQDLERLQKKR